MDQQAEAPATSTDKKDQPGYGKPGKHSWKVEGKRSARNTRRLMGWHPVSHKQREDRAAAHSEFLPPRRRAALLREFKREQALAGKPVSSGEPPRAQRRAELKNYARKVHVSARLVWATYQDEKRKGLQKAA